MKKNLWVLGISAVMFMAMACNSGSNRSTDKAIDQRTVSENTYTCPMHPEVVQEGPGDCPKCGMQLMKSTEVKQNDSATIQDTM